MHEDLEKIRERCIEASGNTTQSLGSGRVIGQIFAHLYLSEEPQTLDDLTKALRISKGSASTSVRQLEQWGAVRRMWIKGDRKDYYEALEDFGRIVRKALLDNIKGRIEEADQLLLDIDESLELLKTNETVPKKELSFFEKRIQIVKTFRERAGYIWDKWIFKYFIKK
ncbi:MAG: MarR family transcriptional regulator [Verrucomicrobiota bacterium]